MRTSAPGCPPATYGRLPNLAEIEATLGNDETGHIGYMAREH